ncbi:MAG: hypothetical protein QM645_00415 [Asticcacaulis sp.]
MYSVVKTMIQGAGLVALMSSVMTSAVLASPIGVVPVQSTREPVRPDPRQPTVPYSLQPQAQGITCANGTLEWPAELRFPAGIRLEQPKRATPTATETYVLGFSILKNGRMTDITTLRAPSELIGNQFLPTWAAAWSLGPQAQTLTDCRMTWMVRDDHPAPEAMVLSREATHLRNILTGVNVKAMVSEPCRQVAKRVKALNYPDRRKLKLTPGHPQWVAERFDVNADGKVKVTAQISSRMLPENVAQVSEALSQRSYYDGDAAEGCLTSFAIPAGTLPVDDSESWGELMQLHKARLTAVSEKPASETCPPEELKNVVTFAYRPELYPQMARRHKIEGVAYLVYDVASWGELKVRGRWGHPLPQFAQAAETMLRQSKVAQSARGLGGCRMKVKFVIQGDRPEDDKATLIGADGEAAPNP